MNEYLDLMADIVEYGHPKNDRTGTGTIGLFGQSMSFDLTDGKIPLITTRKVPWKSFVREMLWFISGSTDIKYLKDNKISIWDNWVIPQTATYDRSGALSGGSIGTGAYGAMWRNIEDTRWVSRYDLDTYRKRGFEVLDTCTNQLNFVVRRKIDQLANAIELLRTNPDSRRIVVSAWNPAKIDEAVLPPCHTLFQFYSRLPRDDEKTLGYTKRQLELLIYCRSQDYPIGTVFNIAQYGLLAHMVAQVVDMQASHLTWFGGDVHIYNNQIDLAKEHLERQPTKKKPRIVLNPNINEIDDFKFEDINIEDYEPLEAINYPIAI